MRSLVLLVVLAVTGCASLSTPRTALNDAIVAADLARVTSLIDSGVSPDEPGACEGRSGDWGATPLVCAIENGRPDAVRLLVGRGADVNRRGPYGNTPLMAAAVRDIELVRLLLDKGAAIDLQASNNLVGWTALQYAVSEGGKTEVVRLLLDRGADIDGKGAAGHLLLIAAYRGRVDLARILMAKGADIDAAIARAEAEVAQDDRHQEDDLAAVRRLKEWKQTIAACVVRQRSATARLSEFVDVAATYRSRSVKPELPEAARAFRVQAEDAVAQKRFEDAIDRYGKALEISPWWPEGHFNQALLFGESGCSEEAIAAMERYLALVPEAPDARAARDKVYQWKGRIP